MSTLGARRMLGPINLELGGDPEPSGSAASGSFIGISNNINGYFLTSSGSPSQIAGISPAEAAVILGVGSSTGSSGGGSIGSISIRSPNGDYYSVGVTDAGLLTAMSQSDASNTIILKSSDGTCFSMDITDSGLLTVTSGSC